MLRRRRMDPRQNWLTQVRSEAFRDMYARPIYPKNLYADTLPTDQAERSRVQPIQRFVDEGIFVKPYGDPSTR